MKDIDIELIRLMELGQNLTKESAERAIRKSKAEYQRLAKATSAIIASTSLAIIGSTLSTISTLDSVSGPEVIIFSLFLLFVAASARFMIQAHKTNLGIGGYLKIEKTLLINEMPNIFQILSLLGFLTVFLKQFWVKALTTSILTFLLLIYLTSKRTEMVSRSSKLEQQVTATVTVPVTLAVGSLVGLIIFAIASLISAQVV